MSPEPPDNPAPRPLLSSRAESRLGARHRQVLDDLEDLFLAAGFSSMTVGELAAGVGCSRRTLYELAPSKDQLVLIVLDRFLHRVGRTALAAIDPAAPIADQIRAYFGGGVELQRQTEAFADDLVDDPSARRLLAGHFRYVTSVLEGLVSIGIERGELRPVDPVVVALTLTGAAMALQRPELTGGPPADGRVGEIVELVLGSLTGPGQPSS